MQSALNGASDANDGCCWSAHSHCSGVAPVAYEQCDRAVLSWRAAEAEDVVMKLMTLMTLGIESIDRICRVAAVENGLITECLGFE